MNRHLVIGLAVAMICLGLSSRAFAQSAALRIGDGYTCSFAPGFYNLPVYVVAAGPVATAHFRVVASSPVTFISPPGGEFYAAWNPCSQYGTLGFLDALVPAGPSVKFSIVPASGPGVVELTDCDGYSLRAIQECDEAYMVAPYRPTPPDGATGVPTNQLLSYIGDANEVFIGTSPDMQNSLLICNSGDYPCALPLNPGPLAPQTTYYWQAHHNCICGQVHPAQSDVFSFTTGDGPLAVEATTWGRVKALYRQ